MVFNLPSSFPIFNRYKLLKGTLGSCARHMSVNVSVLVFRSEIVLVIFEVGGNNVAENVLNSWGNSLGLCFKCV